MYSDIAGQEFAGGDLVGSAFLLATPDPCPGDPAPRFIGLSTMGPAVA